MATEGEMHDGVKKDFDSSGAAAAADLELSEASAEGEISSIPTTRPRESSPALAAQPKSAIGGITKDSVDTSRVDGGPSPFAGLLAEARRPEPGDAAPQSRKRGVSTRRLSRTPERRIGPYRVLEELGSGGMAVVYKAVQPSLGRIVAVKELRAEYVHDRQVAARFEREATSLATLQHTNIVHIYDFLRDPESAHIVMEFVDGIDLFDVLAAVGRVPPEIAAIIALQVADGLEYAHYQGIVHRDIKPSNVLISKKGEVKIMDFGIARDPGNSELTQVGLAVGTPAYMAPEQIRGDRIDFRTDMFALGIVLYEMLAGEKPWSEEEHKSVTVKVLDEQYTPLSALVPEVPAELEQVVATCLRKNPAERYPSTYAMRRALWSYVNRAVPIDPRVRLLIFLTNRGFVPEAEARDLIEPKLLHDGALRRRDEGIPLPPAFQFLKPVGLAHVGGLVGILLATVLIGASPWGIRLPKERPRMEVRRADEKVLALAGNATPASDSKPEVPKSSDYAVQTMPGARPPLQGNEGFLKVVVDPWARVYVDGNLYDTTPFAAPIPLSPGSHRIGLRNPYYLPVDQVVEIETKKTRVLKTSLIPRDSEEAEGEESR